MSTTMVHVNDLKKKNKHKNNYLGNPKTTIEMFAEDQIVQLVAENFKDLNLKKKKFFCV